MCLAGQERSFEQASFSLSALAQAHGTAVYALTEIKERRRLEEREIYTAGRRAHRRLRRRLRSGV